MKTAVLLPDRLLRSAERLARRLKKTPGQLYAEAIAEYLARHDDDAVTEAMDRTVAEVGATPDPALFQAAGRLLRRGQW